MPAKKVKRESNQLDEQQNRAQNPLRETLSRIEAVIRNTPAQTQSLDRKELIRRAGTACRTLDGSTPAQAVEHRFQDTALAERAAGWTAAPRRRMVHARTGREQLRKTGINLIGDMPWGKHLCQFYRTKRDLIDILVPYFKTGLENNEFCMWVTSEHLNVEDAIRALKRKVKNLDDYIKKGQLEILDYSRWYTGSGLFQPDRVLKGWVMKERQALERGFDGLRITGNTFWLEKGNWRDFTDYEAVANSLIGKYRMLAICAYCLDKCTASEIIEIVSNHQFALVKQDGRWRRIESAEHKRAESEIAKLAKFPDENPNPVLRISREGTVLYSNRAGSPLLNAWQCRDGRPLSGHVCQCVLRALNDGLPRQAEVGCDSRIFSLTFAPVMDSNCVNVYALDITERKQTEAMLQASEKKFRDLIETTTDWVWEVDAEGTYTYVSPKVTDLLGYDVNDVLGKTPFDFMPKEEADKIAGIFKEKVIRKEPFNRLENINRHKDGHLVVLETSGIPLLGEEGQLEGYRGIDRDITERKKADQALREIQDYLNKLIRYANAPIMVWDADLKITRFNRASEHLTGYTADEVIGKELSVIFPEATRRESLQKVAPTLKGGQWESMEIPIRRKDGDMRLALWNSANIYGNDDTTLLATIAQGMDITERKQAEQKVRELNEKLEKRVVERTARLTRAHKHLLEEIKERKCLEKELLSISEREQRLIGQELHDSIGQQFAGIAFLAKVLEQKLASKLPDEAADAAEIARLVNQATDQARDLAKGLHPVDLDAGSLVSALRELAAATEHLFGIRCTLKADEHIPIDDTTVAIHLYRITQEAITNAIKHSRAKNIRIALTAGSDKSVLMVESDGLAFPEVVVKGAGMGLQIMDHRADMIHGSLNIRCSEQSGTILTCVFPNKKQ